MIDAHFLRAQNIHMLCDYRYALGRPGEGAHKHFAGIAIFDVLMTLITAGAISYLFEIRALYAVIVLFCVGIFAHWLFCVDTAVAKILRLA